MVGVLLNLDKTYRKMQNIFIRTDLVTATKLVTYETMFKNY